MGKKPSNTMFSFRYLGCQFCDSLAQGEACHFSDLRLRAICSIRRKRELADCTERHQPLYTVENLILGLNESIFPFKLTLLVCGLILRPTMSMSFGYPIQFKFLTHVNSNIIAQITSVWLVL